MKLNNGIKYRGAIIVDSGGIPVPKSVVKNGFESIGFIDTEIWSDPDDLPLHWPNEDKEDVAPFMTSQFWGEGTWNGVDNSNVVMSGPNFTIAWIRKLSEPKLPEPENPEPELPGEGRHEGIVKGSRYTWVPPVVMLSTFALTTAIWIKGSK